MLDVKDIHTYYGKSYVLQGVSLSVGDGEIVGILGRNGVGKTTTLRSIMGLTPSRTGKIVFDGREIQKMSPHLIPRLGIGYVPQGRRIFPKLTVLENLRTPVRAGKLEKKTLDEVYEFFPRLAERVDQAGGTLSGGEQQMLAIGRALMMDPKLIILDEPTEGLMPSIVKLVRDSVRTLNRTRGVAILLVEQNIETSLEICDRLYLMEKGRIIFEGTVSSLNKTDLLSLLGI
jgi:branched-chain amino acid transport system ATP-binding protein